MSVEPTVSVLDQEEREHLESLQYVRSVSVDTNPSRPSLVFEVNPESTYTINDIASQLSQHVDKSEKIALSVVEGDEYVTSEEDQIVEVPILQ